MYPTKVHKKQSVKNWEIKVLPRKSVWKPDGIRNGCEEQITGQCKQEVMSQAFPEQCCRDLPQIVVYQETDHPPKEEETVYEVRKETKVFRWFQRV